MSQFARRPDANRQETALDTSTTPVPAVDTGALPPPPPPPWARGAPPAAPAPAHRPAWPLRAGARIAAVLRSRRAPLGLLLLVLVVSVGARVYHLDNPSESRPTQGFIFDEKYYVNAARVIAGVTFPSADAYNGSSPNGTDPNAEHPQGGKLIIAAGIKLFGDNPIGWRIGAVVFGTLVIVAMYWLVLCAGGSSWLALGAATLMAFENLELLHGRIAVLDVYTLPLMILGVGLYLKRRPVLAGIAIGVATNLKLFGAYALLVVVIYELFRLTSAGADAWGRRRGRRSQPGRGLPGDRAEAAGAAVVRDGVAVRPLPEPLLGVLRMGLCALVAALTTLVVLGILDHFIPAYSNGRQVSTNLRPWDHLRFMYDYGRSLTSPDGPKGIASYPWQFWFDIEAANYYTFTQFVLSGTTTTGVNTLVAYQGLVNPVLLVLALPTLAMCGYLAVRRRDTISFVVLAWVLATWLPPFLASELDQRTTYLYYMVVILPGICLGAARLLGSRFVPRVALGIWIGCFVAGFGILYPFRDWGYLPAFFGLR